MKNVLYLSSWRLFKDGSVEVPFIFEQIGSLSNCVHAKYAECRFASVYNWIWLFLSGSWLIRTSRSAWANQRYPVTHYCITLPKLSTRLTSNPVWRDFYIAGLILAPLIKKKLGGIDLIHTHVILPVGAFACALKRRLGVPFLLQEHSGPFQMHCRTSKDVEGVRFVLNNCSMVLPVSESLKKQMLHYSSNDAHRYRVVPNLLQTDIFKPIRRNGHDGRHHKEIKLISVCSAQKVKRHDLMFQIVRALLKRQLQVSLTILGIDDTQKELVELRDEMGVGSVVSFRGRVSRENIFRAFCEHDIYLCTSDIETFGLAPAEAVCSGLPVVSSDCGGVNEFLLFPNTAIVPRPDPELYAEEIVRLTRSRHDVGRVEVWNEMNSKFGQVNFNKVMTSIYENVK